MIYEMPEGRDSLTIDEVLQLAGGPLRPRGNNVMQIAFDEAGREHVIEQSDSRALVRDGEILMVVRQEDVQLGVVELVGHVRVPGRRSLATARTVGRLIGNVNSFKPDPYLLFAALETTDPQTRARRLFPLNLQNILEGKQDFSLRDGDRLVVLGADELRFISSPVVQRVVSHRLEFELERLDSRRESQAREREQQRERERNAQAPPSGDDRVAALQQVLGRTGPESRVTEEGKPQRRRLRLLRYGGRASVKAC